MLSDLVLAPSFATRQIAAIILAAGIGSRMRSDLPKILHKLAGRSLIHHVLASVQPLQPDRVAVIIGPNQPEVVEAVAPWPVFVQPSQRGTGDAVRVALPALAGFEGDVVILCGDVPLIRTETLQRVRLVRAADQKQVITVLGFRPSNPTGYGRLVTDPENPNRLLEIIEESDCNSEQHAIGLCNSGLIFVSGSWLPELLAALEDDTAQNEFYITDIVGLAQVRGLDCGLIEIPAEEAFGVNNRTDLAQAEQILQEKLRQAALMAGVTLIDPTSVYLAADTVFGRDVVVEPCVIFGPGVRVGDGAVIHGFSHITGAEIGPGVHVGPFARLREGTQLARGVRIGNFVETKQAILAEGSKANHLTYLGDCHIGAGANIGAGTITCNYDGFSKYRTVIGAGAFIGSNTALVAPISIGAGAIIGAGGTVTNDVPDEALILARGRQSLYEQRAKQVRADLKARASAKISSMREE